MVGTHAIPASYSFGALFWSIQSFRFAQFICVLSHHEGSTTSFLRRSPRMMADIVPCGSINVFEWRSLTKSVSSLLPKKTAAPEAVTRKLCGCTESICGITYPQLCAANPYTAGIAHRDGVAQGVSLGRTVNIHSCLAAEFVQEDLITGQATKHRR